MSEIDDLRAENAKLKAALDTAQGDACAFMMALHELQEQVNTTSDYGRGYDVGYKVGREKTSTWIERCEELEAEVAVLNGLLPPEVVVEHIKEACRHLGGDIRHHTVKWLNDLYSAGKCK
jgi:hypothetical protein